MCLLQAKATKEYSRLPRALLYVARGIHRNRYRRERLWLRLECCSGGRAEVERWQRENVMSRQAGPDCKGARSIRERTSRCRRAENPQGVVHARRALAGLCYSESQHAHVCPDAGELADDSHCNGTRTFAAFGVSRVAAAARSGRRRRIVCCGGGPMRSDTGRRADRNVAQSVVPLALAIPLRPCGQATRRRPAERRRPRNQSARQNPRCVRA